MLFTLSMSKLFYFSKKLIKVFYKFLNDNQNLINAMPIEIFSLVKEYFQWMKINTSLRKEIYICKKKKLMILFYQNFFKLNCHEDLCLQKFKFIKKGISFHISMHNQNHSTSFKFYCILTTFWFKFLHWEKVFTATI